MKVLSISTDRKIFEQDSAVRARMIEYGQIFDELHIIIFAKKSLGFKTEQIANNVWVYPTNSRTKLSYIRKAVRTGSHIIKERGITIVSTQDPFETGIVGARLKNRYQIPLQVQIHTDFLSDFFAQSSWLNSYRVKKAREILPRADKIRVVSYAIKNALKKISIPESRITVLPIFVDAQKYSTDPKFNLKEKYSQFDFIILMTCRLEKEKNIDQALDITNQLLATHKNVGLVIVGEGQERSRLEKKVRKLGIEKSVIFESWQNEVLSYYKTADIFLQTSLYEGYGMSLVEAALSGLPIITSNVGIASELINDNQDSYICPVKNTDCFVHKMDGYIRSSNMKNIFSDNIREKAKKFVGTKEQYLVAYKQSFS